MHGGVKTGWLEMMRLATGVIKGFSVPAHGPPEVCAKLIETERSSVLQELDVTSSGGRLCKKPQKA